MNCVYRGRSTTEFYLASVLYDCIEDRNRSGVSALIRERRADANIVLPLRGIAPFHQTVAVEDAAFALETTVLILRHGGDPNVRSDEGLTPLHVAAAWGRRAVVDLLLRCGADPDLLDDGYMTPAQHAAAHEHSDVVATIRAFVDGGVAAYFEPGRGRDNCTTTLDRVLITHGQTVGEYEVVVGCCDARQQPLDLRVLPQTEPDEYVRDWCNTLEHQLEERLSLSPASAASSSSCSTYAQHVTTTRPTARPPTSSFCSTSDSCECESGVHTIDDDCDRRRHRPTSASSPLHAAAAAAKDTSSDYYTCTDVSEIVDEPSCASVAEVRKYVDPDEDVCLYEKRVLPAVVTCPTDAETFTVSSRSSKVSSLPASFDYDTDALRLELTKSGFEPGPITQTTKRVYLRKLRHLQKHPPDAGVVQPTTTTTKRVYSGAIEKTLRNPQWSADLAPYRLLEEQVAAQFAATDATTTRRWREGVSRTSFAYLLLDPRVTQNLPARADRLSARERWETFLAAVFYVGKGKRSRPYQHLYEAARAHRDAAAATTTSAKLRRIVDIWRDGRGVVCLHVFQNVMPVEAYTREAAMIAALRLPNVANARAGDFYGVAATWTARERETLGVYLLHKAMLILLNEGERQLSPNDVD